MGKVTEGTVALEEQSCLVRTLLPLWWWWGP